MVSMTDSDLSKTEWKYKPKGHRAVERQEEMAANLMKSERVTLGLVLVVHDYDDWSKIKGGLDPGLLSPP